MVAMSLASSLFPIIYSSAHDQLVATPSSQPWESKIAPDWLLPTLPTAGGYVACSQCNLISPPSPHLIWSFSLISPYTLQTQGGTVKALQLISLKYLSHLVQKERNIIPFTQNKGEEQAKAPNNSPKKTSLSISQLQFLYKLQVGDGLRVTTPV